MAAERIRKYREKLKQQENHEKYEEYLRKNRENSKKYILKQLQTKKSATVFRSKQRKSLKKFRAKQNQNITNGPIESTYTSTSARSKAVTKAQKALPADFNKRKEVISILAKRKDVKEMTRKVTTKKTS